MSHKVPHPSTTCYALRVLHRSLGREGQPRTSEEKWKSFVEFISAVSHFDIARSGIRVRDPTQIWTNQDF